MSPSVYNYVLLTQISRKHEMLIISNYVHIILNVCVRVWMQGRGSDREIYVMHYSIRLCIVVMFHV